MQTSSTLRTCSSGRGGTLSRAGFTLVELLISIAIIGVVTSIVLVKYGTFDSTVLLKGLAYEIALTLREAQVRSVSVARNAGGIDSGNFDDPFGVTFSLANPKEYVTFRYTGNDSEAIPAYVSGGLDTPNIRAFPIGRTMLIKDLCIYEGATKTCGVEQLDTSFRRPKFKGLIHAVKGPTEYDTTVTSAKIIVGASGGINDFAVEVSSLGQISVYKETP